MMECVNFKFNNCIIINSFCFKHVDMTWLLVTLNMIGKMFNAAAYAAIYMFAAELFPTVIRNGGMGVSSVMARVGGILSDYVILLVRILLFASFEKFQSITQSFNRNK